MDQTHIVRSAPQVAPVEALRAGRIYRPILHRAQVYGIETSCLVALDTLIGTRKWEEPQKTKILADYYWLMYQEEDTSNPSCFQVQQ